MGKLRITGIDIGHHSIKAVALKSTHETHTLTGCYEVAVTPNVFSDNYTLNYQEIVKKLKELRKGLPWLNRRVALSIPENAVITKVLQLERPSELNDESWQIHDALQRQVTFPVQDVSLDFVPLTSDRLNYQVYAAKRDMVTQWIDTLKLAGFQPFYLTTEMQARLQLWQHITSEAKRVWLVDVGLTRTLICCGLPDHSVFTQTFSHSPLTSPLSPYSVAPTAGFTSEATIITPERMSDGGTQAVDVDRWVEQFQREWRLFGSMYGDEWYDDERNAEIVLVGGGAYRVAQRAAQVLNQPCRVWAEFPNTAVMPAQHAAWAGAFSIALRAQQWWRVKHAA